MDDTRENEVNQKDYHLAICRTTVKYIRSFQKKRPHRECNCFRS